MSKATQKAASKTPLQLSGKIGQTEGQVRAAAALSPSHNAAFVMDSYQANTLGNDVDINGLIEGLNRSSKVVNDGDLTSLEAMLVGQATALQTIFTSLARRAQLQDTQRNFEAFLGLALKAQAQSRATLSALVDLKYPRQATFVTQANISNGPQQVNNGNAKDQSPHARESQTQQNELLEDQRYGSTQLGTRATAEAARSHSAVEALESVNRAAKRRR